MTCFKKVLRNSELRRNGKVVSATRFVPSRGEVCPPPSHVLERWEKLVARARSKRVRAVELLRPLGKNGRCDCETKRAQCEVVGEDSGLRTDERAGRV